MQRRDFVKGILAASAAARALGAQQSTPAVPAQLPAVQSSLPPAGPVAPGPTPWMSGLMEVKPLELGTLVPDAVAQTDAHFFNPQQRATLRRLCEVLMPPLKGYPGALDAGTPAFLDFLIGASPRQRQQIYQSGLDDADAEARRNFGIPFAKVTNAQADALIRPLLRTWMADHPPMELHTRFINLAHSDIRTATINSQAWSEATQAAGGDAPGMDLYWYPVDPDVHRETAGPLRRPVPQEGKA